MEAPEHFLRHLVVRPPRKTDFSEPVKLPETVSSLKSALHVLLVEDDPVYAMLVQIVLEECEKPSFSITHVETLADALECVHQQSVDVVLLDLSLPDVSGMDTVVRMRDAAVDLPLVVMTGLDDSGFAAQALELGVQDYLVKSDEPHRTVVRSILNAISRMNAQREREALHLRVSALLNEVASERARLQAELDHARKMQMAMLPTDEQQRDALQQLGLSIEAYFEPCSIIGGDLWGVFPAAGECLGLYSFDFSGHGVGAALNVFRLHALLMEHARGCDDPAWVLGELNRILCNILPRGQYATMFLSILDPKAGQLRWAGAGAPSPLLIVGDRVSTLNTRGTPLGLMRRSVYENRHCDFPGQAGLFVYSDAIPEATLLGSEEQFDEEGLLALAQATLCDHGPDPLDRLIDAFLEQVQTPLSDDLTAIWVRRMV